MLHRQELIEHKEYTEGYTSFTTIILLASFKGLLSREPDSSVKESIHMHNVSSHCFLLWCVITTFLKDGLLPPYQRWEEADATIPWSLGTSAVSWKIDFWFRTNETYFLWLTHSISKQDTSVISWKEPFAIASGRLFLTASYPLKQILIRKGWI